MESGAISEPKQEEERPVAVESSSSGDGKVYHERQRMQFCLLHALNNLMQHPQPYLRGRQTIYSDVFKRCRRRSFSTESASKQVTLEKESFTRAELDGIAENLVLSDPNKDRWTPLSLIFKPHHNVLTGNYDINVLISALEARKKKMVWHDHRKGASSIDLNAEALIGLMINVPVRRLGGLWSGRHWVAIRSIHGIWFNLDSDFSSPGQFLDKEELVVFLDSVLSQGGELMIVLQDE